MRRFHIHAQVSDIQASVAFYSKLFAQAPARHESDYAKWMLEDPRINFAISTRGGQLGVDHLGLQADTDEELSELKGRTQDADMRLLDEGATSCCYAKSDKYWLVDPQGIAWEQFRTLENIPVFGQHGALGTAQQAQSAACCANGADSSSIALPAQDFAGGASTKPGAANAACTSGGCGPIPADASRARAACC